MIQSHERRMIPWTNIEMICRKSKLRISKHSQSKEMPLALLMRARGYTNPRRPL